MSSRHRNEQLIRDFISQLTLEMGFDVEMVRDVLQDQHFTTFEQCVMYVLDRSQNWRKSDRKTSKSSRVRTNERAHPPPKYVHPGIDPDDEFFNDATPPSNDQKVVEGKRYHHETGTGYGYFTSCQSEIDFLEKKCDYHLKVPKSELLVSGNLNCSVELGSKHLDKRLAELEKISGGDEATVAMMEFTISCDEELSRVRMEIEKKKKTFESLLRYNQELIREKIEKMRKIVERVKTQPNVKNKNAPFVKILLGNDKVLRHIIQFLPFKEVLRGISRTCVYLNFFVQNTPLALRLFHYEKPPDKIKNSYRLFSFVLVVKHRKLYGSYVGYGDKSTSTSEKDGKLERTKYGKWPKYDELDMKLLCEIVANNKNSLRKIDVEYRFPVTDSIYTIQSEDEDKFVELMAGCKKLGSFNAGAFGSFNTFKPILFDCLGASIRLTELKVAIDAYELSNNLPNFTQYLRHRSHHLRKLIFYFGSLDVPSDYPVQKDGYVCDFALPHEETLVDLFMVVSENVKNLKVLQFPIFNREFYFHFEKVDKFFKYLNQMKEVRIVDFCMNGQEFENRKNNFPFDDLCESLKKNVRLVLDLTYCLEETTMPHNYARFWKTDREYLELITRIDQVFVDNNSFKKNVSKLTISEISFQNLNSRFIEFKTYLFSLNLKELCFRGVRVDEHCDLSELFEKLKILLNIFNFKKLRLNLMFCYSGPFEYNKTEYGNAFLVLLNSVIHKRSSRLEVLEITIDHSPILESREKEKEKKKMKEKTKKEEMKEKEENWKSWYGSCPDCGTPGKQEGHDNCASDGYGYAQSPPSPSGSGYGGYEGVGGGGGYGGGGGGYGGGGYGYEDYEAVEPNRNERKKCPYCGVSYLSLKPVPTVFEHGLDEKKFNMLYARLSSRKCRLNVLVCPFLGKIQKKIEDAISRRNV